MSNKFSEINRKAWNQVADIHKKTNPINLSKAFKDKNFTTFDKPLKNTLLKIGLKEKKVAQFSCNNGRELLSMMNLGALYGTGFDISDKFIDEANELAKISEKNADFVRTDILELETSEYSNYDLLLITIGALSWIENLEIYFNKASEILNKNGLLIIQEHSFFLNMFPMNLDPDKPFSFESSYFDKGPHIFNDGLDYYGCTKYDAEQTCEFFHTFSDMFNAIIKAGFEIKSFNEYPNDITNIFTLLGKSGKFPCSFILIGEKK